MQMDEEVRQWCKQTHDIHTEFFRSDVYTHLWINPDVSDGKLKWRYQFLDFGMCHVVEHDCDMKELMKLETENERKALAFGPLPYESYIQSLYMNIHE